MDKHIIRASGKMGDIIAALKTLQAIFGKGATLSDVAINTRYSILNIALKKQFQTKA